MRHVCSFKLFKIKNICFILFIIVRIHVRVDPILKLDIIALLVSRQFCSVQRYEEYVPGGTVGAMQGDLRGPTDERARGHQHQSTGNRIFTHRNQKHTVATHFKNEIMYQYCFLLQKRRHDTINDGFIVRIFCASFYH